MSNEWRDLPTMADVAAAQTAGDEIEIGYGDKWATWDGKTWAESWFFRARPVQPKMKKVKILGWVKAHSGLTITQIENYPEVNKDWIRYPKLDDEIEVPE